MDLNPGMIIGEKELKDNFFVFESEGRAYHCGFSKKMGAELISLVKLEDGRLQVAPYKYKGKAVIAIPKQRIKERLVMKTKKIEILTEFAKIAPIKVIPIKGWVFDEVINLNYICDLSDNIDDLKDLFERGIALSPGMRTADYAILIITGEREGILVDTLPMPTHKGEVLYSPSETDKIYYQATNRNRNLFNQDGAVKV